MDVAENKRIVQAFYDAANRGDTEGFLGRLAEDSHMDEHRIRKVLRNLRWQERSCGKACETSIRPTEGWHRRHGSQHDRGSRFRGGPAERSVRDKGRRTIQQYVLPCIQNPRRDGKIFEVTEYFNTELVTAVFGA